MPIVITGASGFVGQNLSSYLLEENLNVLPVSLRTIDWKRQLGTDTSAIIHLAGKAHDTSNTSDAADYFKVNTELTQELFDLFLESEARDFIYFSSVKAVADSLDGDLDESFTPNPKTPYGLSKLKAEQYLLSQLLPAGKRLFIIRPCMIHGPGNKGNLNLLYKFVAKGIPYPLVVFENRRSFLSIENLCFAIHRILINKSIPSGIYNLSDDEALSTNEVVKIIATTLNKKQSLLHVPKSILTGVARLGDIFKLPLNSDRLKKLTENYVVSNRKIKKALDINSFPVTSTEGLVKTIKSFQAN